MPLATSNTPVAAASNAGPDGGIFQAFKPGTTQSKAYTATSAAIDNAIGTTLCRVWATTDCHIAVGSSPTATTSDMPLTGGIPEYIVCNPDDKIAARNQTNSGTLFVTAAAVTL